MTSATQLPGVFQTMTLTMPGTELHEAREPSYKILDSCGLAENMVPPMDRVAVCSPIAPEHLHIGFMMLAARLHCRLHLCN